MSGTISRLSAREEAADVEQSRAQASRAPDSLSSANHPCTYSASLLYACACVGVCVRTGRQVGRKPDRPAKVSGANLSTSIHWGSDSETECDANVSLFPVSRPS